MTKTDVVRIDNGKKQKIKDMVTDEIPLTIQLDGKELLTMLCSPDSLKELSVGFLYSAGLIKSMDQIKNITIDRQNWISYVELNSKNQASELIFKRLYTSGCGKGAIFYNALDLINKRKITSNFTISAEKIIDLMDYFQKNSLNFRETGGVHSAALSDSNKILVFKEDIGRHNALDKVIGEALKKGLNMEDLIVLSSGRISSEIVLKVEKIRSVLLISRSAPTNQAIKLAKELNLTLVGFVRGKRINVYTANGRIV